MATVKFDAFALATGFTIPNGLSTHVLKADGSAGLVNYLTDITNLPSLLTLGETSVTAYRGDRGKVGYDHSLLTIGNPHSVTKADVGLGNVENAAASTLYEPIITKNYIENIVQFTGSVNPYFGLVDALDLVETQAVNMGISLSSNTTGSLNFPSELGSTLSIKRSTTGRHQRLFFPYGSGQSTNDMYIQSITESTNDFSAWYKFYHSGNSNLSTVDWVAKNITATSFKTVAGGADKALIADGSTLTVSQAASLSTIVQRTVSGYINCNYLNATGSFAIAGQSAAPINFIGTNGTDTYARSYTAAAAAAALGLGNYLPLTGGTLSGTLSGTNITASGTIKSSASYASSGVAAFSVVNDWFNITVESGYTSLEWWADNHVNTHPTLKAARIKGYNGYLNFDVSNSVGTGSEAAFTNILQVNSSGIDVTGAGDFSGVVYHASANGISNRSALYSDVLSVAGAYLPLAGGTLSGALSGTTATFSGTLEMASLTPALWWKSSGVTNQWRMFQSASHLYLDQETLGGGNFYLRNTANNINITLSPDEGNATFSGSVTAANIDVDDVTTLGTYNRFYGASNTGVYYNTVNNGGILIAGGNTTSGGANMLLNGGTNASPSYFRIRQGTTTIFDIATSGTSKFYDDLSVSGNFALSGTGAFGGKVTILNTSGNTAHAYSYLDVNRNDDAGMSIMTPDSNNGYLFFGDSNPTVGYIKYDHVQDRMVLRANGNVDQFMLNADKSATLSGALNLAGNIVLKRSNAVGEIIVGGGLSVATAEGQELGAIKFWSDDASILAADDIAGKIASVTELYNGAYAGLSFQTSGSSSPYLIERMRLSYRGNLILKSTTDMTSQDDGVNKLQVDGSGIFTGNVTGNHLGTIGNNLTINSSGRLAPSSTATRRAGMYGVYDSNKIGHIWSMGIAHMIPEDGSDFGGLYGLAYKHTNNTTGGTMAGGHQMVWCQAGVPYSAMGTNIWTSGTVTAGSTMTATNFILSSDRRLKGNILPISSSWTDSIEFVSFHMKKDKDKELRYGVIAQEVEKLNPEMVKVDEDGIMSVKYIDLLIAKVARLEERISELEKLK